MKAKILALILLASFIVSFPSGVSAQTPVITVINGTVPLSTDLKQNLETWLNANPPASVAYYAPTSIQEEGMSTLISLVGLVLSSPNEVWHLETQEGEAPQVMWLGTVRMFQDGTGELYSTNPTDVSFEPLKYLNAIAFDILRPYSAGGGSYVQWPFDRSAQYGTRGVHGSGDYGTSGMYAVDLLGGNSLGTNAMSNRVYASGAGSIDYVCEDSTSVAVRTHGNSDYFLYAHLLSNANLTNGHSFSKGGVIGTLKSGTFNDTCGWASQSAGVYHVHWMFTPASGKFRVENCTIATSSNNITCGSKVIAPGGWISSNGGVACDSSNPDDPAGCTDMAPSFWDNPVGAIVDFVGKWTGPLPTHSSPTTVLRGIQNGIDLVFRLTYVFARGNLNLAPIAGIMLIVLAVKIMTSLIWLVWWVIRAIYNIIPTAA